MWTFFLFPLYHLERFLTVFCDGTFSSHVHKYLIQGVRCAGKWEWLINVSSGLWKGWHFEEGAVLAWQLPGWELTGKNDNTHAKCTEKFLKPGMLCAGFEWFEKPMQFFLYVI